MRNWYIINACENVTAHYIVGNAIVQLWESLKKCYFKELSYS